VIGFTEIRKRVGFDLDFLEERAEDAYFHYDPTVYLPPRWDCPQHIQGFEEFSNITR
jgi:hypothetical protein